MFSFPSNSKGERTINHSNLVVFFLRIYSEVRNVFDICKERNLEQQNSGQNGRNLREGTSSIKCPLCTHSHLVSDLHAAGGQYVPQGNQKIVMMPLGTRRADEIIKRNLEKTKGKFPNAIILPRWSPSEFQ